MSLERWKKQNANAVRYFEEQGILMGRPTGKCHPLIVASLGNGAIPRVGMNIFDQRALEHAYGLKRSRIIFSDDVDPWEEAMCFARENTGIPIAVEGRPHDCGDAMHIAAYVWSEEDRMWVILIRFKNAV